MMGESTEAVQVEREDELGMPTLFGLNPMILASFSILNSNNKLVFY